MRERPTIGFIKSLWRSRGRFSRGESGSMSVEFALWTPFMLIFPLLVADTSFVFARQASLLNISRETARIVARHASEPEAATQYAETEARHNVENPQVSVTIDQESAQVTVTILVEMQDIAPFGVLASIQSKPLTIQTIHKLEPI